MSSASPNQNQSSRTASGASEGGDEAYPEQRHAGAIGYGPGYAKGAPTSDKIAGFKDVVKGKILRKPDVVQYGHELRTGEIKKKRQAQDDTNPFRQPGDDQPEAGKDDEQQSQQEHEGAPQEPKSETN
ncbi:hypothetical protein OBBRIDRAFT_836030 [Obba rivulosa]|uniref:Uncharacterized protein n=1 Tax=Obba rivulosa TaxID=1052685 RepID=A0A8E2ARB3_9APHY|nr:hypothetical protein OBBRIDRAFT_836030 [Obba rivulosa]